VFLDAKTKRYICDIRKNSYAKSGKTKYEDGDFDYLAINFEHIGWVLYSWNELKGRSQISILKTELESKNGLQLLRKKL